MAARSDFREQHTQTYFIYGSMCKAADMPDIRNKTVH